MSMCLWAMVHAQCKYITLSIVYMAMYISWVPYHHIHVYWSVNVYESMGYGTSTMQRYYSANCIYAMYILWVPYYHIHTMFSQCRCVYELWYIHNAKVLLSIVYMAMHILWVPYNTYLLSSVNVYVSMGYGTCTMQIYYPVNCLYGNVHIMSPIPSHTCILICQCLWVYGLWDIHNAKILLCQLHICNVHIMGPILSHTYYVQSMSMCLWAMVYTQCKGITVNCLYGNAHIMSPIQYILTEFSQCLCVYGLWYIHNANILLCQLSHIFTNVHGGKLHYNKWLWFQSWLF